MFDQQPEFGAETEYPPFFLIDQFYIDNGVKCDSRKCMIAVSLEKAGCKKPVVSRRTFKFSYKEKRRTFLLDKETCKNIEDFDNGKKVNPFILECKYEL